MSADQQQELETLRARVAAAEAATKHSVIGAAIATALSQSGVPLRPNVHGQLIELLRPTVTVQAVGVDAPVVARVGGVPVNGDWVRQTLNQPDYAHFRTDQSTTPPATPPLATPAPAVPSVQENPPADSLGARIVQAAFARQAASAAATEADPVRDTSVPMGLRAKRGFIAPGRLPMG